MGLIGVIKNGVKTKVAAKLPNLFPASRTTYDNTSSGLSANRVQGAIDEVNGKVDDAEYSYNVTLINGWTGSLNVLYNKRTRLVAVRGVILADSATDVKFAHASASNTNPSPDVPVGAQGAPIQQYNQQIGFSYDGSDWWATVQTLGSTAINIVYSMA